MPKPPTPIPSAPLGVIRTGEAHVFGVSRARARRSDIAHPFHGVLAFDSVADTIIERCLEFRPLLLPGQWFSHLTALALLGAPLPHSPDELHLSVRFPRTPPRGAGVVGHSLRRSQTDELAGLPVSAAASAWCESASLLRRTDLVAVGDFLVTGCRHGEHRSTAATTPEELRAAAELRPHSPGATRMRWALERIRTGVDSRAETLLRLALVDAGLPEPEVDVPVRVAGGRVLHADLGYPQASILIEYEGDGHRTDGEVWRRDIERCELMEAAGQRVVRVTSLDTASPHALARLAERLRRLLLMRRAESPLSPSG